jgi:hypothetical protein
MSDNTNGPIYTIMPVPNTPANNNTKRTDPVKIATPDVMLYTVDDLEIQAINDILFENIGGQELISISRNDILNGQNVSVQPIKNLKSLALKYNPKNIVSLSETSASFFSNFPISLESYLPNQTLGTKLSEVDADGNLVINFVNVPNGEQIEVQLFAGGNILDETIFNDTMYGGDS